VQEWLATYLELARQEDWDGDAVPAYVEREFRRFLECGILACGFARAYCDACGHDFLVAFSCKGRGVCPSCMARRMAETAAHLVDHVFPSLPVRQWVISFPKRLRYFLHRDAALRSAALRIVLRVIEQALREQSHGAGPTAQIGAVAFIHHFGASLNEHTHFHICVIDGVFGGAQDDSPLAFFEATAMDAPTVAAVQGTIRRRILRLFVRRALLEADDAKDMGAWQHDGGFSLDASVRIEGHDRQGRERLLRYCARPPFALERIERIDEERILYHLPKPTPGGQTRLTLTPREFIGRLAALIPAPRLHRHRNSGVLAPNARLRLAVTAMACEARPSGNASVPSSAEGEEETGSRSAARYLWAMLLARLYEVFPLLCPSCGASMRIIAFITDTPAIRQILDHIGEPSTPPPLATARSPPGWDSAETSQEDPRWGFPAVDLQPDYEHDQSVSW
jgi:hypothetical protein